MPIAQLVEELSLKLKSQSWKLVTAESCTGGGLSYHLTALAGCSEWFDRAFVTYSDQAKMDMLEVSQEALARFGAVSEQVATEMALNALRISHAQVSVSITGIAGPSGGSPDKPVGTVWIGVANHNGALTSGYTFKGDRAQIREQAMINALTQVLAIL